MQRTWVVKEIYQTREGLVPNANAGPELEQLLVEVGAIMRRVGGTVAMISERAKVGPGDDDVVNFQTTVRWESTLPAAINLYDEAQPAEPPAPEPAEEPEPVPAPA